MAAIERSKLIFLLLIDISHIRDEMLPTSTAQQPHTMQCINAIVYFPFVAEFVGFLLDWSRFSWYRLYSRENCFTRLPKFGTSRPNLCKQIFIDFGKILVQFPFGILFIGFWIFEFLLNYLKPFDVYFVCVHNYFYKST